MLRKIIERAVGLAEIDRLFEQAKARTEDSTIYDKVVAELSYDFAVVGLGSETIPAKGPLVVVANHPSGGMEGVVLPSLLMKVRPDLRILSHAFFGRWSELAENMIFVNPQATGEQKRANGSALVAAARWVRGGGALLLFPAGEVAGFSWRRFKVVDRDWRDGLAHLMRMTGAQVLPVKICARNTLLYEVLSALHPRLAVLLLPREMLLQRTKQISFLFGRAIPPVAGPRERRGTNTVSFLRNEVESLVPNGGEVEMKSSYRLCSPKTRPKDWIAGLVEMPAGEIDSA